MDIEKEKKREAAYWRERYNILNQASENFSRQAYKEVERAFELAQKDIQRDIDAWMNRFADNNGITLVEAKKLLNSDQLKEFKWDVAEYIKRGKENAISKRWEKELENASARLHISRLEALQIQVQNHLETAFAAENKAVDKLIKDVYKNNYYHTAFEIQKGAGIGFDIAGIDEKKLDMIAKKPWTVDRRTFSDRIWKRKDQMVNALHQEMIRNCIYGRSREEMTAALEQYVRKDIKNAKYCAARVVKTETSYFGSLSQKNALDELGCDKYQIDMPITPKSCEICREMNGKVFKTSEFEVGSTAPPFHPNCENGSLLPYYDDDFGMDGEPIDEGLSYEEWEKKYVKVESPNADNSQFFKPIDLDTNNAYIDIKVSKAKGTTNITAYRAVNTKNNIYISQNAKVKPKFQHEIDTRFTEVYKLLDAQNANNKPLICIIGFDEMGSNALASFNAVKNVIYVSDKLIELENDYGAQLACPGNRLSTILHECLHWKDAADYALKFGKITQQNYDSQYIPYLNKVCKKRLDKLAEKGYNIYEISKYAFSQFGKSNYDEVMVEYNVKKILKG